MKIEKENKLEQSRVETDNKTGPKVFLLICSVLTLIAAVLILIFPLWPILQEVQEALNSASGGMGNRMYSLISIVFADVILFVFSIGIFVVFLKSFSKKSDTQKKK